MTGSTSLKVALAKSEVLRAKSKTKDQSGSKAELQDPSLAQKKKQLADQLAQGQLGLWPETERGLPNELARSAVFSAANKKVKRTSYAAGAPLEVSIIGGGKVTIIGEELRQDDETVWMELVHRAKDARSESIEFVPHELILALKWPANGESYKRLLTILRRLSSTLIEVYSSRFDKGVPTRLVHKYEYSTKDTQRPWKVHIFNQDDQLLFLFDKLYTRVNWERRLGLPSGVATWLHTFYSSHRDPFPHKVETLARGAGLKLEIEGFEELAEDEAKKKLQARMKEVRRTLGQGLDALVESGFLQRYKIERGLVSVWRTADEK